jgi:anti-anti-sigma factor
MVVKTSISENEKAVSIIVDQHFDFSLHQSFREAYSKFDVIGTHFILDLKDTEYIDSSALGMILLLKDHVDNLSGTLLISKPNDTVNKILEIAQFHRLMTIES